MGGGQLRVSSWYSVNANATTSIATEFKPRGFVLIAEKPTDTTQHVAYYTNLNPDTQEIDESGRWWRKWDNNTSWSEIASNVNTYSVTNNSFTTSAAISGYATIQGLIYIN